MGSRLTDQPLTTVRRRGRAITAWGPNNAPTTELRARGFPINHRRRRLHPRLRYYEDARLRRVARRRPPQRRLWMPLDPPVRDLPLTRRAQRRAVGLIWRVVGSSVWPRPRV